MKNRGEFFLASEAHNPTRKPFLSGGVLPPYSLLPIQLLEQAGELGFCSVTPSSLASSPRTMILDFPSLRVLNSKRHPPAANASEPRLIGDFLGNRCNAPTLVDYSAEGECQHSPFHRCDALGLFATTTPLVCPQVRETAAPILDSLDRNPDDGIVFGPGDFLEHLG